MLARRASRVNKRANKRPIRGVKHKPREIGALLLSQPLLGGLVFAPRTADLFLQINSLKMFGRNLSDCLGLLYSRAG